MSVCAYDGCSKEARAAVRTTRPRREDLRVLLYVDDRVAPQAATRYCKEHVVKLLGELAEAVVADDDEEEEAVA